MKIVCPLCKKRIAKNGTTKVGYRFYCKKCGDDHSATPHRDFDDVLNYCDRLSTAAGRTAR